MRKSSFYYSNKSNDNRQIYQGGEKKVMRKSLSLLLAIAMVFSMFSSLAFAADEVALTTQQKYDALAAKGIFAGINGEAALDQNMNRAQFARVAALILGLEGIGSTDTKVVTEKPFSDVELGTWYAEEIAAVKEAKVFVGNADGTFNPKGDIKVQELAVVAAGLLGLEEVQGATVTGAADWAAGYIQALINAKVDFPTNYTEAATRADLASLSFQADAVINPVVPAVPATLEVKSVSSANLKTFAVVFNQPVDKDTVTNDGTVKVTDVPSTVKLSDDGLTAFVVLNNAAAQSKELEFVINGVKTKDAKEIKDYKVKVVALDSTVPVATGATFINHKQIEVQFSEPVNFAKTYFEGLNNVKLDGVNVVAKTTVDYVKNTVLFEFASLLKDGTVKFEVSDIPDFATYKIAKAEFDVLVVEDKAAPVIKAGEMKNLTTVEVTFDERVDVAGTFKVNGNTATATEVTDSNKTKYSLTGFGTLDLGATVEVKVANKGQKDVAGNEVKDEATFTFKVTDDTELPAVTVKVEKGNKIVLTFSKSMQTTLGTIKVLDKDKKEVESDNVSTLAGNFKTNNTVLELTTSDLTTLNNIDAGTYFINIKDMKDSTVRTNLLPEQTLQITALDTKAPTLAASYIAKAGTIESSSADFGKDDTITFVFNEAVDADTAKNLSNYVVTSDAASGTFTSGPLTAASGVSFKSISADGKNVVITFPYASTTASPVFTVYVVKDVAGNPVATTSGIGKYGVSTFQPVSVEVTAKNKVAVTFDTAVGSVDPSAFAVFQGTGVKTQFVSASIGGTGSDLNKIVTFTTATDLGASSAAYSLKVTNTEAVKNEFGTPMNTTSGGVTTYTAVGAVPSAFVAGNLVDKIKPSVTKSERGATGHYEDFVITFDEAIVTTGGGTNSLIVVRNNDNERLTENTNYTLVYGTDTVTVRLLTTYNNVLNVTIEIGALNDVVVTGTPNDNAYASITSSDKIVK